jgi:flagellar motor switch protein FliM
MAKQSSEVLKSIDPIVLARLTGNLGDVKTVARCCSDVAALECHLLGDMIREEMGLELTIEYSEHRSGMNSALIQALGSDYTLTSASIRNWCQHFVIGTKNELPIAMIAQLLGDPNPQGGPEDARPLSSIECDIAALVFKRIVSVLRCGLNAPGDFEPVVSSPYPAGEYTKQAAEVADGFAAAIELEVTLGTLSSKVVLVIPQHVLLKTTITKPAAHLAIGQANADEALTDRVLRSQVDLCARIKLTPLKLSSISKLRPGDTIPFEDIGEVSVDMDANGKMMYRCEFGRSGDSYSVKIKSNASPDNNTLKQILNI